MNIPISGRIDERLRDSLFDLLKDIEENEPLQIYFDSQGGEVPSAFAIVDMLNTLISKGHEATLISTGELSSIALAMFLLINAPVKKVYDVIITAHLVSISYEERRRIRADKEITGHLQRLKELNEKILKYYERNGMTKEIIEEIRNGEDVIISYKNFINILKKNIENIKKNNNKLYEELK